MMKIPRSQQSSAGDTVQGPQDAFVLMAAATMHKMGRLVQNYRPGVSADSDVRQNIQAGENAEHEENERKFEEDLRSLKAQDTIEEGRKTKPSKVGNPPPPSTPAQG